MVSTGIVVLIAIIALLIGAVGGFFLARKYMKDYLEKILPLMRTCCDQ
ncbi:YneF family protein [Enterococcus lactis]